MNTFNVGDKVKRVEFDNGGYATVGQIAEVIGHTEYDWPMVKYDGEMENGDHEVWCPSFMERI